MPKDLEMNRIIMYVKSYRARENVIPSPGMKPELSCEIFGEGYNLLYRQLITTNNGDGCWPEIEDDAVRQLVIDEINKDIKEIFKRAPDGLQQR
jgi:hypothetical protein